MQAPRLRLVGRANEVTALENEFTQAAAGEFRVVLLYGEAGVGKSRLGRELLAQHPRTAGTFARAHPLGVTAAFGLWAEAIDPLLEGRSDREVTAMCGGLLDDLASLFHRVAAIRGSLPDREPRLPRLLQGLAALLRNLAAEAPVLAVLDDVHFADASSWEALRYFARHLDDTRLLVVATSRPADLAGQDVAAQALFELDEDGFLQRLEVRPLEPHAMRELAETIIGRVPPAALIDWIAQRSQGNPLYAISLLRALLEERADLSAPSLRRLPEGLTERMAARTRGADATSRAILEMLAVAGRPLPLADLAALISLSAETLDALLEGLITGRAVTEGQRAAELTYEIQHPLLRDVIYQEISGPRKRTLHRQAARSLLDSGRLDGGQRDLEQFGHLTVAVSAVVGQSDRLTLHLGEPVQAAPDPLPVQARLDRFGDLIVRRREVGRLVLPLGRGRRGADTIDGATVGDGHHPGRRATHARVEPRGGPPHLQKDLLGHLLGLCRIAQNSSDHAVHRAGQPVVHSLERDLVPACHVDQQVIQVLLSPPILGQRSERGRVRVARVHITLSGPKPDRMGRDSGNHEALASSPYPRSGPCRRPSAAGAATPAPASRYAGRHRGRPRARGGSGMTSGSSPASPRRPVEVARRNGCSADQARFAASRGGERLDRLDRCGRSRHRDSVGWWFRTGWADSSCHRLRALTRGYAQLATWAESFGPVDKVGMEDTGSFGAGLLRFLADYGLTVIEVDRPDRAGRRRNGKSDPLDAKSAARAVQSGRATRTPKSRDAQVEMIRVLRVARRGAMKARIKDYVARRTAEGKTKTEIMRCLKRYIAREVFPLLVTQGAANSAAAGREAS